MSTLAEVCFQSRLNCSASRTDKPFFTAPLKMEAWSSFDSCSRWVRIFTRGWASIT